MLNERIFSFPILGLEELSAPARRNLHWVSYWYDAAFLRLGLLIRYNSAIKQVPQNMGLEGKRAMVSSE